MVGGRERDRGEQKKVIIVVLGFPFAFGDKRKKKSRMDTTHHNHTPKHPHAQIDPARPPPAALPFPTQMPALPWPSQPPASCLRKQKSCKRLRLKQAAVKTEPLLQALSSREDSPKGVLSSLSPSAAHFFSQTCLFAGVLVVHAVVVPVGGLWLDRGIGEGKGEGEGGNGPRRVCPFLSRLCFVSMR